MVVWTPGPANSAYFEHAFLARQMGVELVEASDLVVRDGLCYMRTTRGLAQVDSIYRRIDDAFMDPLEFRPDSLLGVPGLMGVYRAGNVAIANAVGTGVADDKAIYHYVPEMIRFYLGEEPILDNLPTWLLADPEQRAYALEHMHELVIKPTGESGGKGVFIGPHATEEQLADERALVEQAPERWIAQQTVALSTVPTALPDGSLAPRHVDLRPFAIYGDEIKIIPGGLTRVALREGSMIVNSSQGGGSKDTWVLSDGRTATRGAGSRGTRAAGAARHAPGGLARPGAAAAAGTTAIRAQPADRRTALMLARIAHDLYWLGRHLVRAEHTARMLDGLFHADLQGRPDDPASVTLSWESLLVIMGAGEIDGPARRDDVVRLLTTDVDNPVSIISCVNAAREGARTLRDTISAEMWESVNTFELLLSRRDLHAGLRAGPYSIYSMVKERSALFWGLTGRTMQKDDARAFLQAGGRLEAADMVLRMLRVALPPGPAPNGQDVPETPRRDGNALALLRAVGGFQAFMRSAAAPPNAGPVARFMLYEREFPDSVAASVHVARHRARAGRGRGPGFAAGAACPAHARRPRLPRARGAGSRGRDPGAAPDPAGARAARRRDPRPLFPPEHRRRPDRHRMRYLLRYHAEYRYSGPVFDQHNVLRVTPATTPLQRVRGFRVVVEPSARTRTYSDYFGTEVVEFNVPGRARAAGDHGRGRGRQRGAERAAARRLGADQDGRLHGPRRRVPAADGRRARQRRLRRSCVTRSPRTRPGRRSRRSAG